MGNMLFFAGVALGLLVLVYSLGGWPLIILLFLAAIAFQLYRSHQKSERQRLAAARLRRQQEAAERAAHEGEQTAIGHNIVSSCDQAQHAYHLIPPELLTAEELLNKAEFEFREGAFSPFWETIEHVLQRLSSVDDLLGTISRCAHAYEGQLSRYEGHAPAFPVTDADLSRLAASEATRARMSGVVREAQRDFQFATIYEQRRTTSVLIAGFATLGSAIEGMGQRLADSLEEVSDRIRDLEEGQRERHAALTSSLDRLRAESNENAQQAYEAQAKAASKAASDAERQLAMLDNLQRGRAPLQHERGPRRW